MSNLTSGVSALSATAAWKTVRVGLAVLGMALVSVPGRAEPTVTVHGMAPLRIADPRVRAWNEEPGWHYLYQDASTGRSFGVESVAIDFWWGMVQERGRDAWDARYYDLAFQILKDAGVKKSVEMSMHTAGVNVADNVYIEPPKFHIDSLAANDEHPDLAYTSEGGARNPHLVSVWGLDYVIDDFKRFWTKFRDYYGDRADEFSEIIIGMQSAGELRLPSYDEPDRQNGHLEQVEYPGRGMLQISSQLARQSLREYLKKRYGTLSALNSAWAGSGVGPFKRWEQVSVLQTHAEVEAFYQRLGEYSPMGQDVFEWQNQSLMNYGYRMLEAAIEVFHAPGSGFSKTPLAFKIPGLYWDGVRRRPQLAAGLISTWGASQVTSLPLLQRQPAHWSLQEGFGYKGIFERILLPLREKHPNSKIVPLFTCVEKADCPADCLLAGSESCCHCRFNGRPIRSQAEKLPRGFGALLAKHGFEGGVENAMADGIYDAAAMERTERILAEIPQYKILSLLRLSDAVNSQPARDTVRRITTVGPRGPSADVPCRDQVLVLNGVVTPNGVTAP